LTYSTARQAIKYMILADVKFQTLHDHYKETLAAIKESNKLRDRLMIFLLVVVLVLLFQMIDPNESAATLSAWLSQKLDVTLTNSIGFVSSIVWFSLLAVMVRYFQTVIFAERQYPYLHNIEEKISSDYGDKDGG